MRRALLVTLTAERGPGVTHEAFEHGRGETRAEEERRGVFDLVRLVEDDGVVVRQHRGEAGVAEREVGKEQVVVDDHQLGALCPPAHAGREAVVVVLASGADSRVRTAHHARPDRVFLGDRCERGAVAGIGRLDPVTERGQRTREPWLHGVGTAR